MTDLARIGTRCGLGLLVLLGISACERNPRAEGKQVSPLRTTQPTTQPTAQPSAHPLTPAPTTHPSPAPDVLFEAIDPAALSTRGAPSGMESRFVARPAVVASPCGFHLVVSETGRAWTTLLVGHELAWTKEDTALLLKLDGLVLDVGLVDGKTMGSLVPLPSDRLLQLAGQWETTWLGRDAGIERLPVKENARGQAHLQPHLDWRVWSTTLGDRATSAGVRATHAVVATVALDQRVLVLRALLDGDALALRALRRLVFAVDSIETRAGNLGRRDFIDTLKKASLEDPTCATIHATHDAQLK
jgi:hypothetical protein